MDEHKNEMMMTELRRIVRLLALVATQGQNQTGQITTLDKAGFRPVEISEMLGIPAGGVRARLSQLKKRPSKSRTKVSKAESNG